MNTSVYEFRSLVREIAAFVAYKALKDLPLHDVEIETPLETCMAPMIEGRKLAIVPILRAGLGMVDGNIWNFIGKLHGFRQHNHRIQKVRTPYFIKWYRALTAMSLS